MRKVFFALFVLLNLISPIAFAEESSDMCRQECADDGTDPDECQMDCNTVAHR